MMNLNRKLLFVTLIWLAGGLLFWLASALTPQVHADTPPTCSELQIVFLIDQSGSMGGAKSGSDVHPAANDPDELRFYAAENALNLLGPLRYGSHPDATVRAAMVNFGSRPEPGFPWTTITATNDIEWNKQFAALSPAVQASRWITRNLGGTNFVRAFQAAGSLFSQVTPKVGNCPTRAIILLTDGKPEVSKQEDSNFTVANHFTELRNYLTQNLSGTELYVVAISQDAYWTDTEPYWEQIAGDPQRLIFLPNANDVPAKFTALMKTLTDKLIGTEVYTQTVCPGDVTVPPYLQWVSFILYKTSGQNDHLQIADAKGTINQSRSDVTYHVDGFDGPVEKIQINQPLPGKWSISTLRPRAKCDLDMLYITAIGRLVAPDPKVDLPLQYTRIPIAFTIGDAAGGAMPDYGAGYYLKIQAQVKDASGVDNLSVSSSGRNTYTGQYLPIEPGAHELQVFASTLDTGKVITVVNQPIASFRVDQAKLVFVDGPQATSLPQYSPISITLAIAGQNQKPAHLDLPVTVEASVTQGEQNPNPMKVTEMPDGRFTGSFIPPQPGAYRLTYQASVNLPDNSKRLIGNGETSFNIYPTTPIKAIVVSPNTGSSGSFEALSLPGQSKGLIFEVQLADQANKPLEPGQVVDGDLMNVFKLRITDSNRNDRSSELVLSSTAQPGLFRAEGKTLGPGEYNIDILPVAKLKQQYAWSATAWTYKVVGTIPMWVYGIMAIVALIGLDLARWGISAMLVRPHSFRGTLVITELKQGDAADEDSGKPVWRKNLPRANYVRYANGFVWKGPFPWYFNELKPKWGIRSIEVRSDSDEDAHEGKVRVTIRTTKNKIIPLVLYRTNQTNQKPQLEYIDYRFYIYLK